MNSFKYIYLFNLLENHLQSSLQKKIFVFGRNRQKMWTAQLGYPQAAM